MSQSYKSGPAPAPVRQGFAHCSESNSGTLLGVDGEVGDGAKTIGGQTAFPAVSSSGLRGHLCQCGRVQEKDMPCPGSLFAASLGLRTSHGSTLGTVAQGKCAGDVTRRSQQQSVAFSRQVLPAQPGSQRGFALVKTARCLPCKRKHSPFPAPLGKPCSSEVSGNKQSFLNTHPSKTREGMDWDGTDTSVTAPRRTLGGEEYLEAWCHRR